VLAAYTREMRQAWSLCLSACLNEIKKKTQATVPVHRARFLLIWWGITYSRYRKQSGRSLLALPL